MSAIFIQVKNRIMGKETDKTFNVAAFSTPGGEDDHDYISILMKVGLSSAQLPYFEPLYEGTPQVKPARGQRPRRFCLTARGLTSNTYCIIKKDEEKKYESLVKSKDFRKEHPHDSPDALAAITRMKPFWEERGLYKEATWDWVVGN